MSDRVYDAASWGADTLLPFMVALYVFSQPLDCTTYIQVGPVIFHSATLIVMCISYMVGVVLLRFLPMPWREIVSAGLVVVGVHLYDALWGFGSLIFRGNGFPLIPLMSLAWSIGVIVWLDSRLFFLGLDWRFKLCVFCSAAAVLWLGFSGFYGGFTLFEAGLGPDPHNYIWAIGKMLTLISPQFLAMRWSGGEVKIWRLSLA